ncbi:glycosyltransferase [Thomasclavelia cocleata]|uniref:glycosyltransferase n=1 Tax=Thomasclavelia cocleata TaxID=69824 RepID=UPI00248AD3AB|nr:glycosyltransferase [Thomasclavelia cocleata]
MKVAIVTNKMIIGGVEKALINLLKKKKYGTDIDLYLFDVSGDWMDNIPNYVNVVKVDSSVKKINLISYAKLKLSKKYPKKCFYSSKIYPINNVKYDLAISYHAPCSMPVFYTIHNIKARNYILYIHGDVIKTKSNTKFMYNIYKKYNEIKCVSKDAHIVFKKTFPQLKSVIEHNIIDIEEIKNLGSEPCSTIDNSCYSIVTVGRLSEEKGIDLAIECLEYLLLHNYKIKWYVIGEGEKRAELEKLIQEKNLEGWFTLIGQDDNPYKYMAKCDLYVQPSRHEGYCLTLAEALVLERKIVCTEFAGAFEQIEEGKNGYIVKFDKNSLANKISDIYKAKK